MEPRSSVGAYVLVRNVLKPRINQEDVMNICERLTDVRSSLGHSQFATAMTGFGSIM